MAKTKKVPKDVKPAPKAEKETPKVVDQTIKADVVETPPEPPTVKVDTSMPFPVKEGSLHAVKFRGKWVQWTEGTIHAMTRGKEFIKEIEFPPNSEYEHAAEMSKCQNC